MIRSFLTIFFLIFFAGGSNAQEKLFTEQEFIAVMKQYHPVARQAMTDIRIADAAITAARGVFDPVFEMESSSKQVDGNLYYNHRVQQLKIPTWYGIDLIAGSESINGDRINPESTSGALSFVGFSLPLARNLLMDSRRATLQQAKLWHKVSELERRAVLNELFRDGLFVYWSWWEQYQLLKIIENSKTLAEKRMEMVRTGWRIGELAAIDTVEAMTQVQFFEQKFLETEAGLMKSRIEMSAYLWRENNQPFDLPADAIPASQAAPLFISLDSMMNLAADHPELQQFFPRLEALQVERQLKFQSMLPSVNLKYNQLGKGTDFYKTVNAAWFQNNYRFGVNISMPLRLSEGRGELRMAKLKIERTRLVQMDKINLVQNKVKQLYVEYNQVNQQAELQQRILQNQTQLQRGEEIKFFNGESSLFMVNARETKTLEAVEKMIHLQGKSFKTLTQLRWAAGSIF
jgi:outer membrane protein TolC